jgi:hypothetical protein
MQTGIDVIVWLACELKSPQVLDAGTPVVKLGVSFILGVAAVTR